MKIIVEEGDHWPGPPGTYEFYQTRTTATYPFGQGLGSREAVLEMHGRMGPKVCGTCHRHLHCAPTCPERIERERIKGTRPVFDDVVSPEVQRSEAERKAALEWYTATMEDKTKRLLDAYGLSKAKVVTMHLPDRGGIAPIPKGALVFGNDKGEAEAFVPGRVYSEPCRYDFSNLGGNHDGYPTPPGFIDSAKRAAMKRQGTIVELKRECGHCGTEVPTGYCDCDEARADRLDDAAAKAQRFDFGKLEMPDTVDQTMVDVLTRHKDAVRKALDLPTQVGSLGPAPKKCDECAGTGQWENPISGKRSPCSRGCKPCP